MNPIEWWQQGSRRQRRVRRAYDMLAETASHLMGAAETGVQQAAHAHASAVAESWLLGNGLGPTPADIAGLHTNRQLAPVLARIRAARELAFADWLAYGPAEAADIVGEAAPGTAGEPPGVWLGQVGKADGSGYSPALWRVGTGRVGGLPEDGFPVAVPLLDDSHLSVLSHGDLTGAYSLVENLTLRVLSHYRPGLVKVHLWDVREVAGSLPGLYPLTSTGLLTVHDPGALPKLLAAMADRIREIRTTILVGGHASLRDQVAAERDGVRHTPWTLVVLLGDIAARARPELTADIQRVARGGLACGISLITVDMPISLESPTETIAVTRPGGAAASSSGPHVDITLDESAPPADATNASRAISDWYAEWMAREAGFWDMFPAEQSQWGRASSMAALSGPVGFTPDGEPVLATLGDASPHALIGGPSGSGKTNLILAWLMSMAARYSPDELALYLLDFKEGVSFATLAPGADPTWLPHARLVGVNMNEDREYGLALLRWMQAETRRRAVAAKRVGATKLQELRERDPAGHWPRIVGCLDEFQVVFTPSNDAVTKAALASLEDIARRGRSQGIHLVLATQDLSGLDAFFGRQGIFEQFVLRIALPRSRRIIDDTRDDAKKLPRWHAIVNHESGVRHGNVTARIPDATRAGNSEEVQRRLHQTWNTDRQPPLLFDGDRSPRAVNLAALLRRGETPQAVLGQAMSVDGRPYTAPMSTQPGRNIVALGAGWFDAPRVIASAVSSLAAQMAPGALAVAVAPIVPAAARHAAWAMRQARRAGQDAFTVDTGLLGAYLETLSDEVKARHEGRTWTERAAVVLFGADGAEQSLGRAGEKKLLHLLHNGPQVGVHVIGWWRSASAIKSLLSSGSKDDIGAWAVCDVLGADVGLALPDGAADKWQPRQGRALGLDRTRAGGAEVFVVPSLGVRDLDTPPEEEM